MDVTRPGRLNARRSAEFRLDMLRPSECNVIEVMHKNLGLHILKFGKYTRTTGRSRSSPHRPHAPLLAVDNSTTNADRHRPSRAHLSSRSSSATTAGALISLFPKFSSFSRLVARE